MMKFLKSNSFLATLLKQSSWYYLCNALNNGLAILLLPFLSRHLTTAEYGVVQLSTGIGLFLPMLFSLGIEKAIYRYFKECKSTEEQKKLISTTYIFSLVSGFAVLSIFVLSSFLWFEPVVQTSPFPYVLLFAYPYLFAQIASIGVSCFQQMFELKTMTIIEVLGTAINLLLSIALVLTWEDGAFARLFAIAVAFVFKAIVYTVILYRKRLVGFSFDFSKIKEYLSFSIPLMPNSIALWVSRTFDRIIVSFFCGVAANGVYSTGVQVSFVLYFVQDSLSQALGPLQIQAFIEDKKTAMRRLKSLGEVLIILMTVASLLWICICPELMYLLLDSRYLPSFPLVASLSCLYVFQAQYRLYSDVLSYHNKNKYIMYAAIAQAVLSLALNLTLIPILGYEVAGFVSLISVILYMIIIVWSAGKFETIELNKPIFIKYLILLFSLLTAVTIFPNIDMITRYIIAALVILISFKDIRTSFRLLD